MRNLSGSSETSNLELLMRSARNALYIYFYDRKASLFMVLIYFMHSMVEKIPDYFIFGAVASVVT